MIGRYWKYSALTLISSWLFSIVFAQIPAGTYTIGGTSPDYATFTLAIADLNTTGLLGNGPVTFNIRTGTYTEQVVINQIANATAVNTITFQSESGDSSDVILTYGLATFGDNYTLKLDGADYIIVKSITISATNGSNNRAVELTNGAKFNSFISNKLMTISGSNGDEVVYSSSATSNDDDNTFIGNWFLNGSSGLEFEGTSGARKKRIKIQNNLFETYRYAIYLRYNQDVEISGNKMINAGVTNTAATQGIYCFACDSMLTITKNEIIMMNGTNNYGIDLLNSQTPYGGYRGIIANNMITVGGTGTSRGIYTNATTNKDFFNNSILTTGTNNTSSVAFYFNGPSSGTPSLNANFVIRNNIFMADNGYAIINSVGGIIGSDHNDYNSIGAVSGGRGQLGEWDVDAINNLTELRAASGDDTNSVRVDPLFVLPTNLHINTGSPVIGMGEVLAAVIDDIDNESRDLAPDIGADELGCIPLIIYLGPDTNICVGDSVIIGPGGGYSTYLWSDSSTSPTLVVDSAGTYSVTVTDSVGCTGNDAIDVLVTSPPVANITISGSSTFCNGDSVQLLSDSAGAYNWLLNGSPLGSANQSIDATVAGNYQVVASNGGICSDTSSATVITVNPAPAINIGSVVIDSSTCGNSDGSITGITASGGTSPYTYQWLNSTLVVVGGDSANLVNLSSDTYSLTITDSNGCSSLSSSHAVFDAGAATAPVANSPAPYCDGDSIVGLTATGSGGTLYWYSDSALTDTLGTGSPFSSGVTTTDTFYVAESGVCVGTATQVIITINPKPAATVSADTSICLSDSLTLTAGGGDSYLWSNGDTTAIINVSPISDTTYTVNTISADGCWSDTVAVTVNVYSAVNAVISGLDSLCYGDSLILSASGGTSFAWSTGSSAASITIGPSISTNYWVLVTDSVCNLTGTDSVYVFVTPEIIIIPHPDSLFIEAGESIPLITSGGAAYIWSPATGLDDPASEYPIASPTTTTQYTVGIMDSYGCFAFDTTVVVVSSVNTVTGEGVFVPNFITPNYDGYNDIVYVKGLGIKTSVLVIYDRWGEKIFETEGTGKSFAWDGTYQGKKMESQVFVYYLKGEFMSGEKISLKGNITLFY